MSSQAEEKSLQQGSREDDSGSSTEKNSSLNLIHPSRKKYVLNNESNQ